MIDHCLNPDSTKSNCTKELLGKVKALFNFDHDDAQEAQESTEKSVTMSCKQPKQKTSGGKKKKKKTYKETNKT